MEIDQWRRQRRGRGWRLPQGGAWMRLGVLIACVALTACAVQPARLGETPGGYEAFVREVMREAAQADQAESKVAGRAVRSAEEWLGITRDEKDNQRGGG